MKMRLLFARLLMLVATSAMTAQDMEQTAAPIMTWNTYNDYEFFTIEISNNDDDPNTQLFYRYAASDEIQDESFFTEWMPYNDIIVVCDPGYYTFEAYAQAPGKTMSEVTVMIAVLPDNPTHSYVYYDFQKDGIYYNILSDSTVAVTMETDEFIAYPYASGATSYSGDVVIPPTVEYRGRIYTVTNISWLAFWDCDVPSVEIPNTVTTIESEAFMECSLGSVFIPESVSLIEPGAFAACYNLLSVQVDENNPVYDSRDNCNAIIETATNTLVCGFKNTVIPPSVTTLGKQCFGHYPDGIDITSVDIPENVTVIGDQAFMFCTQLKDVKIGSSVTSIGELAFNLTGMTNLILPASVETIGDNAFSHNRNLERVTCMGVTPPAGKTLFNVSDNYDDFDIIYHQAILFVPNEALEAYRSHEEWGKFTHIVPFIGAGPGDVNGDGNISIGDATLLIDELLSGGDSPAWMDVNGDGTVSIKDITDLIDMLLSGGH